MGRLAGRVRASTSFLELAIHHLLSNTMKPQAEYLAAKAKVDHVEAELHELQSRLRFAVREMHNNLAEW